MPGGIVKREKGLRRASSTCRPAPSHRPRAQADDTVPRQPAPRPAIDQDGASADKVGSLT
jgi:hypothetical protein